MQVRTDGQCAQLISGVLRDQVSQLSSSGGNRLGRRSAIMTKPIPPWLARANPMEDACDYANNA
jgi:hypothetical protein